jgi:Ca2+-binding EF-hand superfamily protein
MPLTSKPFQAVEELQSTIKNCILALAVYFAIGTCVFPFLEPSWTFIDALYFSMATLTTVAYGDVMVSGGTGLRATFGKLFLLSFNIYAVCISVSALGIIAKLALAQEKKILKQARQRARARLVRLFSDDDDEKEEEDDEEEDEVVEGREEDEDDPEDCTWADNIYLDKCGDDAPQTMMGALWQSLQRHSFNFVTLIGLALLIVKVEKWSLVDILYYWNCTATTMGYGDVTPQTQIGRLLAVVFIPLSVISLGEIIASCVAHLNAKAAAKAEKDFLRREITFDDLEYLDVNDDGKVCQLDFITFMLLAMQKVDRKTMKDLKSLFKALDAGKTGFIEKEDLILLRQRKRLAKRLRREARNRKKLYEEGYLKIENGETATTKHVYDQLKGYRIS